MIVRLNSLTHYRRKNKMKAIWNDTIIADISDTVMVEGNHYFPMESIKKEYLEESTTSSVCPWKGMANYYTPRVRNKIRRCSMVLPDSEAGRC